MLQIRLKRKTIWAKPTMKAMTLMKAFKVWTESGMKAVSPNSG